MYPQLMLEHQHLVGSVQYILINIHWARRSMHMWQCTVLAVHIRLGFSLCGFAKRLSQQPDLRQLRHLCTALCLVYISQAIWRTKGAVAVFTLNMFEIARPSQKCHTQSCQVVLKVLDFARLLINRFHKREEASDDAEQCIESMDKSFIFSVKEALFHKSKIIFSTSKWQFEVTRKTWTIWRQTC